MRRVDIGETEAALRLEASISGLADKVPVVSARRLLTRPQLMVVVAATLIMLLSLGLFPITTLQTFAGVATIVYMVAIIYRFSMFRRSLRPGTVEYVSDAEAHSIPDHLLPIYTVLVPAYREPAVINLVMANIGRLDYPADRLDVKILIEADDDETLEAIRGADPGDQFELVLIPPAEPRTKPKACNYGLTLARGEIVVIYDAEDEPDPLQLRRAAVALARLGPDVGCVQAKLAYHNVNQNIITKWFTIDYAMWFSFFLPGLASARAPIPLGGTSNHFRREVLRGLGGWDPFNVTEDADLGIRMFREGYSVKVLESATLEEANSDFVNWIRQRSRWYKGYLQTFVIHLREPATTLRELGIKGFYHFWVFVGGTPVLAMLNPVFWVLTALWFVAHPAIIKEIFPAPIYYIGLTCWAFGNFVLVYLTVLSCRVIRREQLLLAALTVPIYWLMMAMAAAKALFQLIVTPTFWEKTAHGLHLTEAAHAVSTAHQVAGGVSDSS